MLANISVTHVKSPQALGLQKASPELGDRPWWLSLYHRFPRTELLVFQPLSPELYKLFETELLVRRVPSHCLFLNVQPGGSYNDTMEDTSPAGKCTNEEEKRGRTKYGAPSTGEEDPDWPFIFAFGEKLQLYSQKRYKIKQKIMSMNKIYYNRNIYTIACLIILEIPFVGIVCMHFYIYKDL